VPAARRAYASEVPRFLAQTWTPVLRPAALDVETRYGGGAQCDIHGQGIGNDARRTQRRALALR